MLIEQLKGLRIRQLSRQQVFFFLVLFLLLWRIPYYGKVILDDPYITFEYAKNLIDHGQLAYNLNEPVLATTTPVYTFIMAGFYALGLDLPTIATIFNLALEIAQLYVLGLLISELAPHTPRFWGYSIAGMLTVSNRTLSISSQSGMETPLFVLLISVALLFILKRSYIRASVFGSLATLTRPDGIFALLLLAIVILIREKRLPVKEVAVSLLSGLPWMVTALILYGSFIPHSVTAKAAVQPIWGSSLLGKFSVMFYEPLRLFSPFYVVLLIAGIWILLRTADKASGGIVLGLAVLFVTYLLLPVNAGFEWYFAPLLLLFHLIIGVGLSELRPGRNIVPVVVGLMAGILYSSVGNYLSVRTIDQIWRDGMFQIVEQMNSEARQTSMIQCTNIGILGYYTDFKILDPLGLASPQVLPLMDDASNLQDLYRRVASEFRPDYVISFGEENYDGYMQQAVYTTSVMPLVIYSSGVSD